MIGACFSTTTRMFPIINPLKKHIGITVANMSPVLPPSDLGPMQPKNIPNVMENVVDTRIVSSASPRCAVIWILKTAMIKRNAAMFKMDSKTIFAASSVNRNVRRFAGAIVFRAASVDRSGELLIARWIPPIAVYRQAIAIRL